MAHLYYVLHATTRQTSFAPITQQEFCLSSRECQMSYILPWHHNYILFCPILPKFGKIPKKAYFAIRYLFKNFSEEKQKHKELKSSIKKALKN